jgi:plasmid stabilization system protein ParE
MNLVVTRAAQIDLKDIYEFIVKDNPDAAERVLSHLSDVIQQLADGALQGPDVRLKNGRRLKRWSAPPYRIYYRRTSRRTVVVRVYHQARRPLE